MIYFVTGGSRGIGRAIVLQAIGDGHDVAFTYVQNASKANDVIAEAKKIREDAKCRAYQLDVRDSAEVERAGDQVVEEFETVDVVVNNAGVVNDGLAVTMSDEQWNDVIATNLTGPFFVARRFLPILLGNGYGRIINISSLVAGGATGQVNYAAAKAGLHGMTQALAKEYGRKNITSNALVLGFFETEMTRETLPQKVREFWKTYCPQPKGRMGKLSEVTSVVSFLSSEEGAFINGQMINLTGGMDWAA